MNNGMGMVYVIREMLRVVKKEMDEKGLTFEEILAHYEEGVAILEQGGEQHG